MHILRELILIAGLGLFVLSSATQSSDGPTVHLPQRAKSRFADIFFFAVCTITRNFEVCRGIHFTSNRLEPCAKENAKR